MWRCDGCGSEKVQFSKHVWYMANDPERKEVDEDSDMQPWKDSAYCYCEECGENVTAGEWDDEATLDEVREELGLCPGNG